MSSSALVLEGTSAAAVAVVRSLARDGWRVVVPAGSRAALSRYSSVAIPFSDARSDPPAFRAALGALLATEPVDLLVPTNDVTIGLLAADPAVLGPVRVMGARLDLVAPLTDKAATIAAAERHGFPVPAWRRPADAEEAVRAAREVGLPCVVKPVRSELRAGDAGLLQVRHRVAESADEVPGFFRAAVGSDGRPPIVQALVPGRALSVGAVVHAGRVLARVARETLSFWPVGGGTSVWKRTVAPGAPGVAEALDLLLALEYEGLAEVEYQLDEGGVPRLMEINVRPFAWLPLAVAAGVDLPLVAARALLGRPVAALGEYRVGVEMRWPAGEVARLMAALRGGDALPPGTSRRSVLAGAWPPWRPGMRYDGISRDDWHSAVPTSLLRARRRL